MRGRRDDQFDRDVQAMVTAYAAAHPLDPIAQLASAVSDAVTRPAAPAPLPVRGKRQGQFPDGTPIPAGFKRHVFERYEALKAAHQAEEYEQLKAAYYRGEVDQRDLPALVQNSAGRPGGPSPMIRQLFELDD